MRIEQIKKIGTGKYRLKIDNNFVTTYDDVLLKYNLLFNKNVDPSLYDKLLKDTNYYDAYNKTINYILKRMRSIEEIKKYLLKFDLKDEDRFKIIEQLKKINLLNDHNYVKSYIADAINLSNDGPDKIREHLLNNQLSLDIIDEELAKIDVEVIKAKANRLIAKKMNNNHKYSTYFMRQKVLMDMVNLGYDRDLVVNLLGDYSTNDFELLEREYTKLLTKLSSKYSGLDLERRLKQKLYAKGFDMTEVNELISKTELE